MHTKMIKITHTQKGNVFLSKKVLIYCGTDGVDGKVTHKKSF